MTPKEIRQLEGTLIQRGYKYLNEGRHRKGFLSPNRKWVVKVPKTCARLAGIQDNWSEYHTFKRASPAIRARLARCRLFKGEILIMEKLCTANLCWGNIPEWARGIDCGQVGYNRKGNLVAYDYA